MPNSTTLVPSGSDCLFVVWFQMLPGVKSNQVMPPPNTLQPVLNARRKKDGTLSALSRVEMNQQPLCKTQVFQIIFLAGVHSLFFVFKASDGGSSLCSGRRLGFTGRTGV